MAEQRTLFCDGAVNAFPTHALTFKCTACGEKKRRDTPKIYSGGVIPTAARCNTLEISIFWWWRASEGKGERKEGGGGARLRCTNSVYEAENKWLSIRERGGCLWEWAREGERETAVMIDARLPPLCSSEWLQQKAQNNIPDSLLCFFSPLSLSLSLAPLLPISLSLLLLPPSPSLSPAHSLSLCVSASRRRLRSQLCRGYAVTELGLEAGSPAAINKLGLDSRSCEREKALSSIKPAKAGITAVERKERSERGKKEEGGPLVGSCCGWLRST